MTCPCGAHTPAGWGDTCWLCGERVEIEADATVSLDDLEVRGPRSGAPLATLWLDPESGAQWVAVCSGRFAPAAPDTGWLLPPETLARLARVETPEEALMRKAAKYTPLSHRERERLTAERDEARSEAASLRQRLDRYRLIPTYDFIPENGDS